MNDPAPVFFTIKPNLAGGRFFFYFGPWDRMAALRDWYLSHGLSDIHHRIKDHATDGRPDVDVFLGQVFDPHPGFPLLCMQAIPHTPYEIGLLVHEIHHAVQRWTEALGIFTCRDSEEIFAYTEGAMAAAVLDYLWHRIAIPGLEPGTEPTS